MKNSIAIAAASCLLSLTSVANAIVASPSIAIWDFKGHLTNAQAASPYQPGDSFEAIVTFDTRAAELASSNANRHSLDISALQISYQIGASNWQSLDASSGGIFYVRDNQPNPNVSAGGLVDGLTFGLGSITLILRWSDLNAVDFSQHVLPANPPELITLQANSFQDGNSLFLGSFDTVSSVPEPESQALLLVGMGLIGVASRHRRLN